MRKYLKYAALVLAPALALAATMLTPASVQAQDTAQKQAPVDRMQFARGAKAWSENCGRCHNIRPASELSDEEWHVSVTHMRIRANLPGDVARDILAFLQASN